MFCFDSVVRYSEMDANNRMTLSALLDLLQDSCIFQSEHIGIGVEFLKKKRRTWALSFWQAVIKRYPLMGERIFVYTWPYRFKNFLGYRNFKVEDEQGRLIAYANSIWTFLDTYSGHPARVPKEIQECYVFEEPYKMDCASRKIEYPAEMEPKEPIRVGRFHIDTNRHVNNSRYVQMAEEFLPENFVAQELRAEYKKAAVLSDMIYPKVQVDGRKITVALEDSKGSAYAVIEFLEEEV